MGYRDWLQKGSTTWLAGEVSSRFVQGVWGLIGDMIADAMIEGLWLSKLAMGEAKAEDTLRLTGAERRMWRYPGEPLDTYRLRLMNAWDTYEFAGTDQSIEQQFANMGLTAEVFENPDWDWDGDAGNEKWWRFWVVIHPPHPWITGYRYGETPVGDGMRYGDPYFTYGTTMSVYDVQAVRDLVRQWKPAHMQCVYIIIVLDETAWLADLPDGSWNSSANRNPAAIYISGE